jgi:hypothetical protein
VRSYGQVRVQHVRVGMHGTMIVSMALSASLFVYVPACPCVRSSAPAEEDDDGVRGGWDEP